MIEFLRTYSTIEKNVLLLVKNFVIIEFFLKLNEMERKKVKKLIQEAGNTDMTIVEQLFKECEMKGELKGELKGKLEGKLEGKIEDARKMLQKGLSIEDILDITELTMDDLIKAGIVNK